MERPKRKSKSKREPDLEFVAPHSLEECVARLQSLAESEKRAFVATRVQLAEAGDKTRRFRVFKSFYSFPSYNWSPRYGTSRSNYVKLEIEGILMKRAEPNSTWVTASARIVRKTFIINGVIFGCFGIPISIAILSYFLSIFVSGFNLGSAVCGVFFVGFLLLLAGLTIYQPRVLGIEYMTELLGEIQKSLLR
jgi:hypothetical protein